MKYIVLGCNHGIQRREPTSCFDDTPKVRQQRSQFSNLVEEIIREHKIQLIAEEWGCAQRSIAGGLAMARRTAYCNINTSDEDLDRMGIPRDYLARENGQCKYGDAQTKVWLRQREEFMVRRTKKELGDNQSVLVICGFEHLNPITDLLRRDCAAVFPVDYRQAGWYRPDVFTED